MESKNTEIEKLPSIPASKLQNMREVAMNPDSDIED
jgi:hypothetical protein